MKAGDESRLALTWISLDCRITQRDCDTFSFLYRLLAPEF
jgi:hypothetical protein